MKKRWLKYLGVCLTLALAIGAGAACKDDEETEDGVTTETIASTISLDQKELNLKVGDKKYIVPSFAAQDGVSLAYASTDETVATVSENGEITALKEGSTDIVVSYGELSATCKVTVSLGGELPTIVVNGVEEDSLQTVAIGETFAIAPYIQFNGNAYEDATFTYAIEDETIATAGEQGLTAAAYGETKVTVTAHWRGVENATLVRTFTLRVVANVELSVNDGLHSSFALYSVAELGERSYTTSLPFVVTANERTASGVTALDASVEIVEGAELITLQDGVISSVGVAGRAIVKISCTASTGETFERNVPVEVLRSVGVYDTKVEFSAVDGELPLEEIFGADEDLTSAECEGETLYISADKKRVLGLETLTTGVTERTITVYGQNVGYEIEIDAYTKIIDEASDLDHFLLGNDSAQSITATFNGYYVLGGNIDASGYVRGTSGFVSTDTVASYATVGLTGTFDGRGYTISNLTFGETAADFEKYDAETRKSYTYSLFGVIGGGTVKNLALENVTYAAPATVTKGSTAALATWVMGGRIENVYVRVNGLNYSMTKWRHTAGLAHNLDENTVLKNCVVEVEDDGTVQAAIDKWGNDLGASYGSLIGARLPAEETMIKNWSGVYVISPFALKTSFANATGEDGTTTRVSSVLDAENANANAETTTAAIKRYDTLAAFMADKNNTYAGFATEYWKVGSIPAWKNLDHARYARMTVDGEVSDGITIALSDAAASYTVGVDVLGEAITDVMLTMRGAGIALNGNAFTVLHAGTAEITATYTLNGKQQSLTLQVGVTAETETYGKTVEFSAMHGELPLADIFGTANVELVAAYQGDTLLTISADKKRILGVQTLDEKGKTARDGAVQTQITVYSASKGYIVELNAYAGILTKAEDLNVFNLDNTDYTAIVAESKDLDKTPTAIVDGYYVLGNDIDASAWAMPTHGYISSTHNYLMKTHGFVGTFDGRGYTISGLTLGTDEGENAKYTADNRNAWRSNHYSLFGILGETATVKNVAITNVQFALKNGELTMYTATCSALAMWINAGATVENVYVSVKGIVSWCDTSDSTTNNVKANTSVSGLAYGVYSGATLNNIVVDYTYDGADVLAADKTGAIVYRKCANDSVSTTWTNIYVLSAYDLSGSTTASHELYAANSDASENVVAGVCQYADVTAWKTAANNDYTAFDSAYWDISTGVPVWK